MDISKWRLCLDGGDSFKTQYLVQNTGRETDPEFAARKALTPIPAFAKESIVRIKNALYQRANDITRKGEKSYNEAIQGLDGGVDLFNSTMNAFIGDKVMLELLGMGIVGVFVDMPKDVGNTLQDKSRPYIYAYKREDILQINYNGAILEKLQLRRVERQVVDGFQTSSMIESTITYTKLKGKIKVENSKDNNVIHLKLPVIPFVLFEIKYSLMTDVADHQIALLNLESSDIAYLYESNFPFYTEQSDEKYNYNKGETVTTADGSKEIKSGPMKGKTYPKGFDRPEFIAPPTEPLTVAMKKEEAMKQDIQRLVNLSVANNSTIQQSADSQDRLNEGLGAGLAAIAQTLESGEREIARIWNMYMSSKDIITIKYPRSYTLKSEETLIKDSNELVECTEKINSLTAQKAVANIVASNLLAHRIPADSMASILKEIQASEVPLINAKNIAQDIEDGLVSRDYASTDLRHYPKGQVKEAEAEHMKRLELIAKSQSIPGEGSNLNQITTEGDKGGDAKSEKLKSQSADLNSDGTKKVRGDAK